jgi:hypothetical protein
MTDSPEVTPAELATALTSLVNANPRRIIDQFIDALSDDHPTLIGQVARVVATGVLRSCPDERPCQLASREEIRVHRTHDARLTCATVYGAELMSRQPVI